MVGSFVIFLPYDGTLSQKIPNWLFLLSAFLQFVYQTLDAIDGKQARNTKSSSPLGQLFDHGCDAFSLTFMALSIAQVLRLGASTSTMFLIGIVQIGFFLFQWIEHHTRVLHCQFGYFGVTESELYVIGILLIAGIFGQDVFEIPLKSVFPTVIKISSFWDALPVISLGNFVFLCTMLGYAFGIIYLLFDTLKKTKNRKAAVMQMFPVGVLILGRTNIPHQLLSLSF